MNEIKMKRKENKKNPNQSQKALKASLVISHHIGVGKVEVRPDSVMIKFRHKDFAESLMKELGKECKFERKGEQITIKKEDNETFDGICSIIISEAKAEAIGKSESSYEKENDPILNSLSSIERRKVTPELRKELAELVERKNDSNLEIGLEGIARYGTEILSEAVKVLKNVKEDAGRVAFYLAINHGISPWSMIDLLEIVKKHKDNPNTLWEFCNDLDSSYGKYDIQAEIEELKEKYRR